MSSKIFGTAVSCQRVARGTLLYEATLRPEAKSLTIAPGPEERPGGRISVAIVLLIPTAAPLPGG